MTGHLFQGLPLSLKDFVVSLVACHWIGEIHAFLVDYNTDGSIMLPIFVVKNWALGEELPHTVILSVLCMLPPDYSDFFVQFGS